MLERSNYSRIIKVIIKLVENLDIYGMKQIATLYFIKHRIIDIDSNEIQLDEFDWKCDRE